jgi:hypothetical protein
MLIASLKGFLNLTKNCKSVVMGQITIVSSKAVGFYPQPCKKYFQFPILSVWMTTSPVSMVSMLVGVYFI